MEERPGRLGTTLVEYRRISVIGKADLGFGSVSISSIRYESLRFMVAILKKHELPQHRISVTHSILFGLGHAGVLFIR